MFRKALVIADAERSSRNHLGKMPRRLRSLQWGSKVGNGGLLHSS